MLEAIMIETCTVDGAYKNRTGMGKEKNHAAPKRKPT